MFNTPLEFTGMFHTKGLTCHQSLKWYFAALSSFLQTFYMFSCEQPVEGQPECLQCSTEFFPHLNQENHSNICSPHGVATESCFEHLMHLHFSFLKQNVTSLCSGS
jgi:hypothetical protein